MKKINKIIAMVMFISIILVLLHTRVFSVNAMSWTDYKSKYSAFINDSRWKSGITWGDSQEPKLSKYGSWGCCAYASDFEYYMYGTKGFQGNIFYNADRIKSGDILLIKNSSGGDHWIIILERNGDALYVAEGNYLSTVRVSDDRFRINNGELQTYSYGVWSGRELQKGYHYSIEDSQSTEISILWSDYNDKLVLTSSKVVVSKRGDISGASSYSITELGISVYNTFGTLIGTGKETTSYTTSYFMLWYDFADELDLFVSPNTTYKYIMYAIVNGRKVYSPEFTVTTPDNSGINSYGNDALLASDVIQIYSQWDVDAYGAIDNRWINGSGCGLLTMGHALQWLGIIERDHESTSSTIGKLFVESGYIGTVLVSERNKTLQFLKEKYPNFKYDLNNRDLQTIVKNYGVAAISRYGHQYLAVDISSDSKYVHIIDSCLYVPYSNNVSVYKYSAGSRKFVSANISECAVRSNQYWYCYNSSTNEMRKASAPKNVYAGGEYWVEIGEVSSYVTYGMYNTNPVSTTIKLTLDPNGGTGGTREVYFKKGVNRFYTDAACTNEITKINPPTRDGYTFDQYYGDGSSGGENGERYIYSDGSFASDLCTDITKDATFYAKWTQKTYYLDVNLLVDGEEVVGNAGEYCTFDVYINGALVEDDAVDYYQKHPAGTTYEIRDIKAAGCNTYVGVHNGSLSGTIGNGDVDVYLSFVTSHNWGNWTNLSETQHQRVCANDPSHIEIEAHDWNNGVITVAPTAATPGIITYTCTLCGETRMEIVSALGERIKGDFDGDGQITVADALSALRIAAKLVPETADAVTIGDTDGDGHVTVSDALSILRVAAKLADASSLV